MTSAGGAPTVFLIVPALRQQLSDFIPPLAVGAVVLGTIVILGTWVVNPTLMRLARRWL